MNPISQMKIIFDDEYSRLYFDEVNNDYVLWLLISHVMWYDVYIRLLKEEVNLFIDSDHTFHEIQFRHFANDVALSRPGLVGKSTNWDDRILLREEKSKLP
jgi:hypothetical protein